METVDIRYLNTFFKKNKDLLKFLEQTKNICLPNANDKGVTTAYLMKVVRGEVFTISKEKYKKFRGDIQNVTKAELNNWITEECGMSTGFELDLLPSKKWLLNCLYSLNPEHIIFQQQQQHQRPVLRPEE